MYKEGQKQRNKVKNNKIKVTRAYKNENEPQHFFSSLPF